MIKVEVTRNYKGFPVAARLQDGNKIVVAEYEVDKGFTITGSRRNLTPAMLELLRLIFPAPEAIKTIENIENIENIESIDLIDRLTLIDTISAITNIANIQSVDLIDAITNIANLQSLDLIDRITLIDDITNIGTIGEVTVANVKTTGGINILIDKLTQGAYTERRSTISNNGAAPAYYDASGAVRKGKFFPRGCRGFLETIDAYCRDSGAAGGTITVYIAPNIGMGPIYSAVITVGAGASADWRSASFNKMWKYDSMFVWYLSSTVDMDVGYDTDAPDDYYLSTDSGVTWAADIGRHHLRLIMKGQTVGDVPVSGTINVIPYPNDATIARPQWHDRNPAQKIYSFYDSGTLPHAETSRNSYTVPANQNLYLESAIVKVMRLTAATVSGWVRARITIDGVTISDAWLLDNNAGAQESDNLRQGIIVLSGSVIVLYTTDLSTDGTTKLELCYKGTLFDE